METGLSTRIIYVFHMPFFFFLSGYVHKTQKAYGSFLRKRAVHLLLPYASFLLLLAPLHLHRASRGGKQEVMNLLMNMLWGGDHLRGDYGVFWFVTCLFATQQIANWLLSRFNLWGVAGFGVVSICLAYVNSYLFPWFALPFDLNVVLGALPFYLGGFFSKRIRLNQWWMNVIAILGITATVWLTAFHISISYDMRSANYGIPFLSLALAACCILGMIRASELLTYSPIRKPLEAIGTASMGIMFLHEPLAGILGFSYLTTRSRTLAFLVIASGSYIGTVLFSRFRLSRAFLLGSYIDFKALVRK